MKTIEDFHFQVSYFLSIRNTRLAREELKKALALNPEDIQNDYFLAEISFLEEEYESVQEHLGSLLEKDPNHFEGRVLSSKLLKELKRFIEGEKQILELLREYPESAQLYFEYAMLLLDTIHLEKAKRLALEGLSYDGSHLGCRVVLVILQIFEGPKEKAFMAARELIEEYPDNAACLVTMAQSLYDLHRYGDAFEIFQEIFRSFPQDLELLEGVVELKTGLHWTMIPLRPLQQWGWLGSGFMFIGAILFASLGKKYLPLPIVLSVLIAYIFYVLYSWIYPSLLKKYFYWRGFK
jgi:tetratricopeptide (TPR) repeat protein